MYSTNYMTVCSYKMSLLFSISLFCLPIPSLITVFLFLHPSFHRCLSFLSIHTVYNSVLSFYLVHYRNEMCSLCHEHVNGLLCRSVKILTFIPYNSLTTHTAHDEANKYVNKLDRITVMFSER
jgi:hypothetical protein